MAYCFREMLFIGQNLKNAHMTYSFLELLIFFWLTLLDIYYLEFISHHIKGILYVNTNSKGNQSWSKNKEIHSHLCMIFTLKNPVFKYSKNPWSTISNFSQFHNQIGALKNFAIFWIKKIFQRNCFPKNIAKFL